MYGEYEKALAGLKYGLESDIVTAAAKAIIQFGEPVLRAVGDDLGGYSLDKITLTFSADFVASNVIAGSILGSAVSVTFATSHAATFAALVAALWRRDQAATSDERLRQLYTQFPAAIGRPVQFARRDHRRARPRTFRRL